MKPKKKNIFIIIYGLLSMLSLHAQSIKDPQNLSDTAMLSMLLQMQAERETARKDMYEKTLSEQTKQSQGSGISIKIHNQNDNENATHTNNKNNSQTISDTDSKRNAVFIQDFLNTRRKSNYASTKEMIKDGLFLFCVPGAALYRVVKILSDPFNYKIFYAPSTKKNDEKTSQKS